MTSPAVTRHILLAEDNAADEVLVREAMKIMLLGGIVKGVLDGISPAARGGA